MGEGIAVGEDDGGYALAGPRLGVEQAVDALVAVHAPEFGAVEHGFGRLFGDGGGVGHGIIVGGRQDAVLVAGTSGCHRGNRQGNGQCGLPQVSEFALHSLGCFFE